MCILRVQGLVGKWQSGRCRRSVYMSLVLGMSLQYHTMGADLRKGDGYKAKVVSAKQSLIEWVIGGIEIRGR